MIEQSIAQERIIVKRNTGTSVEPRLCWLNDLARLETDRLLILMLQLFSFHERSDVYREQKTLSCLKKRAKLTVSHFSPGDEQVT
jgi:hypothetical protein